MATEEHRAETDLLHPLAALDWEYCHPWNNGYCTHCTVLHDRVAVLALREGYGDVVYISSADLQSWTTTTLSYEGMSLTTYKSEFVAVGGCHPTIREPSNLIFSSDTGLQWKVTPPRMPTKRYYTSSVSTRSPEALVVAGGLVSDTIWSDIVEVLTGDKWSTVNPLPTPCLSMRSVMHDGNLYFMGGEGQEGIVYTCSCSALILSCDESTNSITTANSELWSQFYVPGIHPDVVSFSSYLVSIDFWCDIRAYSIMTQSWEAISISGDRRRVVTPFVAAAVLPTGELMCIHSQGVFKIKLLVSSYTPDSRFMSNVFHRLETAMGINIMSVLANNHQQLTTSSGVILDCRLDQNGDEIPLPDPQTDPDWYIDEVMSQWCDGRSDRLPTWRQLLEVLQEIGLPELSHQIDTFMKGEMKFVDAYRHFIKTKDVLEMLFLKFLFVGPPRLGKTTLRRRLMGEISDLVSAGEAEQSHPSTAAVESGHGVMVRCLSNTTAMITTQAEWSAVESITDEARMLFHNFVNSIEETALPKAISTSEHESPAMNVDTPSKTSPSTIASRPHLIATPEPSRLNKFISKMKSMRLGRKRKQYCDIPEVAAIFKESYHHPDFWKEAKHSFKAYLRMEDTGGQPELMDMLPALTVGPGLYLLFFSYELDLKSEFKVFYQCASGETSLPEHSSFTLEEMLLSTLSSISCSYSSASFTNDKEEASSNLHHILESSKSAAYFVGTHKDKVSEAHVASCDKELQKSIRDTDFFENDLVQFCSKDSLVIATDNMGGGADEVNEMRKLLEVAMERHFKKLRIPAVWLLFSLCLRMRDVRTASMEECLELSHLFNMTPYETTVALWFLHHHAGVMMYFPNVPSLEDLVIIDIQVVYDSVTHLILGAMQFGKVSQARAEKFRRSGQFALEDLVTATSGISGDFIPPLKLIALLEYLHIVAHIPPTMQSVTSAALENETVYIMPCVLRSASKHQLDSVCTGPCQHHPIAPLMIRYKCGFVPIGVFPAMVASLISNGLFQLIEDGMMKNLVQFRYGPLHALVTFTSHPKYYGVIISELPVVECEPHRLCVEVRKEVESTLEKVSSHMNYGYFMDYQFAFECPSHPGRNHLCVIPGEAAPPKLMLCLQLLANKVPIAMNECHKVWFGEPLTSLVCGSSTDTQLPTHEIVLESSQCHVAMLVQTLPDLVETIKPSIHSVADHCLSVELISRSTYETILERDLTRSDKARILLNDIRSNISQKPELLHQFITVLHNIGGLEELIHRFEENLPQ